MKFKLFMLMIMFLTLLLLPIPDYVELNHLSLITSMDIKCYSNYYEVSIEEVTPKKEDNGIEYQYHTYQASGDNLLSVKEKLEADIQQKVYYYGIKKVTTNCSNPKQVLDVFGIPSKKIESY